jgi:hypothetical protein
MLACRSVRRPMRTMYDSSQRSKVAAHVTVVVANGREPPAS